MARAALESLWVSLPLLLFAGAAPPQELSMPSISAPTGWKSETISFPLPFAPQLAYEGIEALRFAPGMFTPGSPEFWTYGFVWWLKGTPSFTSARLDSDLKLYFQGLIRDVEKRVDVKDVVVSVALTDARPSPGHEAAFSGVVESFDPFVTHAPVRLNVRAEVLRCPSSHRTAVVFEASPRAQATFPVITCDRGAQERRL